MIRNMVNNAMGRMARRLPKVPSIKWPETLTLNKTRFDAARYPIAAAKATVPTSFNDLTLYTQHVIDAPANFKDHMRNFMPKKLYGFSGSHRLIRVANM
jgi:hypothetical protein